MTYTYALGEIKMTNRRALKRMGRGRERDKRGKKKPKQKEGKNIPKWKENGKEASAI